MPLSLAVAGLLFFVVFIASASLSANEITPARGELSRTNSVGVANAEDGHTVLFPRIAIPDDGPHIQLFPLRTVIGNLLGSGLQEIGVNPCVPIHLSGSEDSSNRGMWTVSGWNLRTIWQDIHPTSPEYVYSGTIPAVYDHDSDKGVIGIVHGFMGQRPFCSRNPRPLSAIGSFLGRVQLICGYSRIYGSRYEGQRSSSRNPYLYPMVLFAVFTSLSFFCFWNLQFGSQDWRLLLALLLLCFFGIMYSTYQFLDAIAEQSQLREQFVANRYEPLGDDVHLVRINIIKVGAILGSYSPRQSAEPTELGPMFDLEKVAVPKSPIEHNKEMSLFELLDFCWGEFDDLTGRGVYVVREVRPSSNLHKCIARFVEFGLLSVSHLLGEYIAHDISSRGFSEISEGNHDIDSAVLHYQLGRILGARFNLYPGSLVFAENVQLVAINNHLEYAYHGKNDCEQGDYGGAVSPRPLAEAFSHRWVLVLMGSTAGVIGLFCMIYMSTFLFSENAIRRGILCMVAGFFLSAMALFLIHEAYK
jgi:hypothetical protein